jgi:hypothetical protein
LVACAAGDAVDVGDCEAPRIDVVVAFPVAFTEIVGLVAVFVGVVQPAIESEVIIRRTTIAVTFLIIYFASSDSCKKSQSPRKTVTKLNIVAIEVDVCNGLA